MTSKALTLLAISCLFLTACGQTASSDASSSVADEKYHVTITEVHYDSQAEKLGLREGDIIQTFEGTEITSVAQLFNLIDNTPKKTVAVEFVRNGKSMQKDVKTGSLGVQLEDIWAN